MTRILIAAAVLAWTVAALTYHLAPPSPPSPSRRHPAE